MPFQYRLVSRGAFALIALGAAVALHAQTPPERLFLQQVSPTRASPSSGGAAMPRTICYSTAISNLYDSATGARCVEGVETEGGHREARLDPPGKQPHLLLLGGRDLVSESLQFRTAPDWNKPPRDGNTHILIVGDSGTQSEAGHDGEAAEVLAGFHAYNAKHGSEPVDLFLALGDTAYVDGHRCSSGRRRSSRSTRIS
jgi:hypothetical protein